MNDEVSNPSHYNQNGIEVIDVIETYAKDDFRLANVIKYVCRCEYKGRKLQDLEKASWYLNRVIDELQAAEDCAAWEADPANADWTGIDRGVSDWTLDDYTHPNPEEFEELLRAAADNLLEQGIEAPQHSGGYTPREVEVFFQGYECRNQELYEAEAIEKKDELYQTFVHPSPDRIAGDNDAAKEIKDSYYGFDRFAIKGHCANCDAEIRPSQPHVTSGAFEKGILFCSHACIEQLRDWQGR